MREKLIIGNWKMNNGPKEGHEFLHELENELKGKKVNVNFAIAAPFVTLPFMLGHSHGDAEPFYLPLAAQNFYYEESGAFTGEVSLDMLDQLGLEFVIIGHSERRQIFHESNELVNKKLLAAHKTEMIPVLAFGETEKEFDDKKTKDVIKTQLTSAFKDVSSEDAVNTVLAYEPIWAIGTGKTATPEQAQEACEYSRSVVEELYGKEVADNIIIQYGGSVKPENVKELMNQKDIDGALVGGASLSASSFAKLITFDN